MLKTHVQTEIAFGFLLPQCTKDFGPPRLHYVCFNVDAMSEKSNYRKLKSCFCPWQTFQWNRPIVKFYFEEIKSFTLANKHYSNYKNIERLLCCSYLAYTIQGANPTEFCFLLVFQFLLLSLRVCYIRKLCINYKMTKLII